MAENITALQVLNTTKTSVINKLENYMLQGQVVMPPNYSFGNAINQAQLIFQDNKDLMACSQASIAKAWLDMAILGLNPAKQQCYFIPYGGQATLQTSYMGKEAIARRIDPTIAEIVGRAVKRGEEFEYEDLPNGYFRIIKHKSTLETLDSKDIIAAYATIIYNDGKEPKSLIMTFERIKKSWSMSKMRPVDEKGNIVKGKTHDKFTEEMAVKTVKSAICKPIINTSDDGDLFSQTVQRVDLENASVEAKATIADEANTGEVLDVSDWEEVTEVAGETTGEQTLFATEE